MDRRVRSLAEQLDAGVIARREFLRKTALITGSAAVGTGVLRRMAHAQTGPKLRVWLFKSFVTNSNDILAKQVENWA
jgi:TRAP-type mannitol/chloroaromatic compound transport system substrate-binding protein